MGIFNSPVKAAPGSDLNAKQEGLLWVVITLGAFILLLFLNFIFQPDTSSLPGPTWLTGPVLGFVVGIIASLLVKPRSWQVQSWVVPGIVLVLVILCEFFQGDAQWIGQTLATFFVGFGGGALFFRAAEKQHEYDVAHRQGRA
ncbi:hypothetical protein [Flexivirga meconopsidis]|uniref:hypothetical protein n=1 Tax=Flexivirga meconopsidis TaxID=2977121 RepID=UPI002240A18F|nr:hypothetical protein [Flexivirga meconopsidis]